MSAVIIIYILAVHWVGDFIMQTDWQATNKHKDWYALTQHVLRYTATWIVGTLGLIIAGYDVPMLAILLIGFTHWITDYFTSKVSRQLSIAAKYHGSYRGFFVWIGFDQLLHYAQIFAILRILN